MKGRNLRGRIIALLLFVVLMVGTVAIALNYNIVRDFLRGLLYKPTDEMVSLSSKLDLTDSGSLILNSSWPELNERDEFNSNCKIVEVSAAILGCYTGEKIYVYDIVDKRLNGIREATLAHELLHAVYARMNKDERDSLRKDLDKVYSENEDILGSELDVYSDNERYEELYVRVGTEVSKLPVGLEEHFGKYFNNQDKIVGFYENYASVFRTLNKKIDGLKERLENLSEKINRKEFIYKQNLADLDVDILEFNNCADTVDCFGYARDFYTERSILVARQAELMELYSEIDNLIAEYNSVVNEYNENMIYNQTLNNIINSAVQPEEIR